MNREYRITDARGKHSLTAADLPLRIGGEGQADIVLPGLTADSVVAIIALSEGHAFVQTLDATQAVYHNHARLAESAWLKSGDCLQIGEEELSWTVQGDLVFIELRKGSAQQTDPLITPPSPPRPEPLPVSAPAVARKRRSPLGLLSAGLLFLSMAAVAAFILLAGTVGVQVDPPDAHLDISGFPPPLNLGARYLALPGEYALLAKSQGYRPWRQQLVVERGETLELDLSLEELPGRLSVETEPNSAFRLFVNDEEAPPNAQGEFEIARGRPALRIVTERYLPEVFSADVLGLDTAQSIRVPLRPAWAQVQLASTPSGAQVHIDNEPVGLTPLSTQVMQGTRTFAFSLNGYKSTIQVRDIKAGETLSTDLVLSPADGVLTLDSQPSGASVKLDGVFQGSTPIRLKVLPGAEHELQLSKAGFGAIEQPLTLAADEQRKLNLKLSRAYGTVFLSSTPADAELLVDGKPSGKATQRLRLSTRRHTLEVRKPGYVSKTLTVTPRIGNSRSLDVKLVSQASQRARSTPGEIKTADAQTLLLLRPKGPFEMGASRREAGRRANENQRRVQLSRAFYIGVKEVSNAQYRRFKPSHRSGSAEGAALDGEDQPVVNLSWEDAARYCNWLSKQEGLPEAYVEKDRKLLLKQPVTQGYRMPTEAEWAYVARMHEATKARKYVWNGNYPPKRPVGNFADAQIADSLADVVPGYDDGFRTSAPVGSFPARPSGFFDLGGNVAEWTNDYYTVYPGAGGKTANDPSGPNNGKHHVIKGASWKQGSISALRLSYRDYGRKPRSDLGFRIARYAQ